MRTNLANADLRKRIEKNGMFLWQIASRIGVSAPTMTIWLREELAEDDERRKRIEEVLDRLEKGG